MVRAMDNSEVTVVNSVVGLAATSNSIVHAINCTVNEDIYSFFGISDYGGTTCTGMGFFSSSFYIYGNISFLGSNIIYAWFYSSVTRNYGVTVRNMTGNFVPNAALTLVSRGGTLIWNGITDNLGQADFNLTFTDSNCTDILRLEAFEGNYSASTDVSFLSDTPVELKMRYINDLNGDGFVNILDIAMVARAYGTKPGDSNWNALADLDKNGIVNILDISMVARDYGKTV
jgi:hypothetical protein